MKIAKKVKELEPDATPEEISLKSTTRIKLQASLDLLIKTRWPDDSTGELLIAEARVWLARPSAVPAAGAGALVTFDGTSSSTLSDQAASAQEAARRARYEEEDRHRAAQQKFDQDSARAREEQLAARMREWNETREQQSAQDLQILQQRLAAQTQQPAMQPQAPVVASGGIDHNAQYHALLKENADRDREKFDQIWKEDRERSTRLEEEERDAKKQKTKNEVEAQTRKDENEGKVNMLTAEHNLKVAEAAAVREAEREKSQQSWPYHRPTQWEPPPWQQQQSWQQHQQSLMGPPSWPSWQQQQSWEHQWPQPAKQSLMPPSGGQQQPTQQSYVPPSGGQQQPAQQQPNMTPEQMAQMQAYLNSNQPHSYQQPPPR